MIMHEIDGKSGFTIVELMMAMLATVILALIVGLMLVYGWMAWHQNTNSVQMQRDTTLAMRVIAKEIRRTPMEGITPGTTLVCMNSTGTVSIAVSGGNLEMTVNSGSPLKLIREFVTSFNSATNSNGSVSVVLNLDTGSDSCMVSNVVYSRN